MAILKNELQYEAIMARVDELFFMLDEDTPAEDFRLIELEVLSVLIEDYEDEYYPLPWKQ